MIATYRTCNRGNLAIERDIWSIPVSIGKQFIKTFPDECGIGHYWYYAIAKPTRQSVRAKLENVRVSTAGFSSSELYQKLVELGCKIQFEGDE